MADTGSLADSIGGGALTSGASSAIDMYTGFGSRLLNLPLDMLVANMNTENNIKLWNMQNAYNSPAAQMARLTEAGLNPNLVYGTGSIVNTSSGKPTYAMNSDMEKFGGDIAKYQEIKNMDAQHANLLAQNDVLRAQAASQKIDNKIKEREYQTMVETEAKSGYALTGKDNAIVGAIAKLAGESKTSGAAIKNALSNINEGVVSGQKLTNYYNEIVKRINDPNTTAEQKQVYIKALKALQMSNWEVGNE